MYKVVSKYAKSILACMENTLKKINIFGECAKSILPYMENTVIDI
jgi:hypothetical protein